MGISDWSSDVCSSDLYLALSIGCGLATSFEMLLALRFVHGLVSAALGVIVVAVIRDLFSGDAMAKRLSLIFLVFMIVPIIAPTIVAGIAAVAGWRAIFIVPPVMLGRAASGEGVG